MEPTQHPDQTGECRICEARIVRHWIGSEWGEWLHVTDGITWHAAEPRYPIVDPFDHTVTGDWSRFGQVGVIQPRDFTCEDCGAEVTVPGRQCQRCTDQTIAELDR